MVLLLVLAKVIGGWIYYTIYRVSDFSLRRAKALRDRRQKEATLGDCHIEGTAELTLEAHTAGRPETTGRMLQVVAGACYARDSALPVPLRLPVEGRVGAPGVTP